MAIDAPFARHVTKEVKAHQGKVYCLDWDCEGQRLASASIDKTVRVWNVEHRHKDREERYENEFKHSSRLYCLHWHPSKPTDLVTSCDDKYIRLFDARSHRGAIRMPMPGIAFFLDWIPDNGRLFDARSHKGAIRMPTPGINIFLGWNPADTNVLATVSDSNVVTFLDMRKGKHLKTLKNRQEVNELAFTQDGKLFMQCTGNSVEVYNTATYEKCSTLAGHTGTVHSISISPDDRHMASGSEDGSVSLWDLDTMACARACTHMDGGVKSVSISHDSQYVAYAGEQDYFVLESLQAGRKPWTVPVRGPHWQPVVDSIAWNPKHLVVASAGSYSDSKDPKPAGNILVYAPLGSS